MICSRSVVQSQVAAAIQILEASHAPEILRAAGPDGLHVDELARKTDELRAGKGPVSKPLEPWRLGMSPKSAAGAHLY